MGWFDLLKGKPAATSPKAAKQGDSQTNGKRYRGVEVVANNDDCCQATRDLEGRRFLISQVPMLPLSDCDASNCQCTYERFDDRRDDLRRASDVAFDVVAQFNDEEHRSSTRPGRRDDDQALKLPGRNGAHKS